MTASKCSRGQVPKQSSELPILLYKEGWNFSVMDRETKRSNLNTFWTHSEHNLNAIWTHFDHILNSIWTQFEPNLNPIWTHCEHIVNTFWTHSEHNLNYTKQFERFKIIFLTTLSLVGPLRASLLTVKNVQVYTFISKELS